jgi:hypothetical protein
MIWPCTTTAQSGKSAVYANLEREPKIQSIRRNCIPSHVGYGQVLLLTKEFLDAYDWLLCCVQRLEHQQTQLEQQKIANVGITIKRHVNQVKFDQEDLSPLSPRSPRKGRFDGIPKLKK